MGQSENWVGNIFLCIGFTEFIAHRSRREHTYLSSRLRLLYENSHALHTPPAEANINQANQINKFHHNQSQKLLIKQYILP